MPTVKDALAELNAHERECAIRYEYIEKRLDEGSAKFTDRKTGKEVAVDEVFSDGSAG